MPSVVNILGESYEVEVDSGFPSRLEEEAEQDFYWFIKERDGITAEILLARLIRSPFNRGGVDMTKVHIDACQVAPVLGPGLPKEDEKSPPLYIPDAVKSSIDRLVEGKVRSVKAMIEGRED